VSQEEEEEEEEERVSDEIRFLSQNTPCHVFLKLER